MRFQVLQNSRHEPRSQASVHHMTAFGGHGVMAIVAMALDVFEKWQAERGHPTRRADIASPLVDGPEHVVDAAVQQVVLVTEMLVERRPSDIRSSENFLDSDGVVGLLTREVDQGIVERGFRPAYSAVLCFRTS